MLILMTDYGEALTRFICGLLESQNPHLNLEPQSSRVQQTETALNQGEHIRKHVYLKPTETYYCQEKNKKNSDDKVK